MLPWSDILLSSFQALWQSFVGWFPNFVAAFAVFFLGLVVSTGLGKLVENVIDALKVDGFIEKMGGRPFFDRAGIHLDSGRFIGQLVQWFLILAFLLASTNILGLAAVSEALRQLLAYVPNVIVSAIIILSTVVLAGFLQRIIQAGAGGANLQAGNFAATIVKWAVMIFGLLAALSQLHIATELINILVSGFVAMIAIAGGLAFGLGSKDVAGEWVAKLKKELE